MDRLRAHVADVPDVPDALVFATAGRTALDADNLRRRMLKPLVEEAGAGWAAFHSFRHTYASMQLSRGVNVVALSRVLGHFSPRVTLDTYSHLLKGDEAPALDLEQVLRRPVRLAPTKSSDAAIREHLETVHYFDEKAGELHEPKLPPPDPSPDDD